MRLSVLQQLLVMRKRTLEQTRCCQTIGVNKTGVIVQCRGLANCDPTAEAWSIVNEWVRHASLQVPLHM